MSGFIEFIKSQGVIGLAVAFILGQAITKVVSSLINGVVMPVLGIVLGSTQNLATAEVSIGSARIMYGALVSATIDFIVIAAVVYLVVKGLGIEKPVKK